MLVLGLVLIVYMKCTCTSSAIIHHLIQVKSVASDICLSSQFSLLFVVNVSSFLSLGPVRSAFSGATQQPETEQIWWMWPGAYTLALRLRWPHPHISHREGGWGVDAVGREGRDTNQTSHFPRSAHKYLCGWFINSGAREEIKVNCNAYIKLGLFHDTALHTMLVPIKDKAIYHEAYWQEYWMATHTLGLGLPPVVSAVLIAPSSKVLKH